MNLRQPLYLDIKASVTACPETGDCCFLCRTVTPVGYFWWRPATFVMPPPLSEWYALIEKNVPTAKVWYERALEEKRRAALVTLILLVFRYSVAPLFPMDVVNRIIGWVLV